SAPRPALFPYTTLFRSRSRSCVMWDGATSRSPRPPMTPRCSTCSSGSPTRSASSRPPSTSPTASRPRLGQSQVRVVVDDRVRVVAGSTETPALAVGLRLLGEDLSRSVARDQGRRPVEADADEPARLRAQLGQEERELHAIEGVGLLHALARL